MKTELYLNDKEDLTAVKQEVEKMENCAIGCTKQAKDGEGFILTVGHKYASDLYYLGVKRGLAFGVDQMNDLINDAKKV